MSLDVMKQALEALEDAVSAWRAEMEFRSCIDAAEPWAKAAESLRAAIEQAQEPVAWVGPSWLNPETRGWASDSFESIQIEGWIPLYTAPRQWQGLTQREIDELWDLHHDDYGNALSATGYERAIEAKLRERNA